MYTVWISHSNASDLKIKFGWFHHDAYYPYVPSVYLSHNNDFSFKSLRSLGTIIASAIYRKKKRKADGWRRKIYSENKERNKLKRTEWGKKIIKENISNRKSECRCRGNITWLHIEIKKYMCKETCNCWISDSLCNLPYFVTMNCFKALKQHNILFYWLL